MCSRGSFYINFVLMKLFVLFLPLLEVEHILANFLRSEIMKRLAVLMLILTLLLISCAKTNIEYSSETSAIVTTESEHDNTSTESSTVYDESEMSGVPYWLYQFSGTDAETERFTVYDGKAVGYDSLMCLTNEESGCKCHNFLFHGYLDSAFLPDEADTKEYNLTFSKGNVLIDNMSPVCEGYNMIQMIFWFNISPESVEKNRININGCDLLSFCTEEQQRTFFLNDGDELTEEEIDLINMAWKNDFCVYHNKAYYTLDWLYENSVAEWVEHSLPLEQLEAIYAKYHDGVAVVEFMGQKIAEYMYLLA